MKQLKRLTSVLLVLGIVLGLMPLSAFAAEPEDTAEDTPMKVVDGENTYTYMLLDDGTVELTGFSTTAEVADVVIPSTVTLNGKDYSVTSIGTGAFYECTALQSVQFEAPIKSIGFMAFALCTGLTSIALPEGLETIGQSAFAYCTGLVSVTIPQSIQVIKYGAFDYGYGSTKKLEELHYTGTKAQWEELMKKEISHADDGHDYVGEIGKMNPMLTGIDQKNFYCAHTVSFDCGSQAAESTKVVVQHGEKVTPPADPKADGYQFEGWYTQKNGGVKFDFGQSITEDVTVYAHWSEVKPDHTVYFNCGGKAEGSTKVVQYGEKVTPPADPKADGYRFEGWYTQENGGVPFDFDKIITEDVTVYAHWSVKPAPEPPTPTPPTPPTTPTPTPDPAPTPTPTPTPNPDPAPTPTPTPDPTPNPDPAPTPTPDHDTDTAQKYALTEKDGTLVRVTVVENGTTVDITEKVVLEKQGTTQIGKIPAGAMVTVAANAAPEGMVFAQWNISDPALMGNPDVAHTSQTMSFPMPAADVTIEAMYESAENARETELLGSAALIGAVGISAVVLAYQAHQLGTELYLKYLLPSGVALPQNRIQLAELLWRNAGEPVPDVNAMYEDIGLNEEAAQQAAQWALENELMELPDEEHTEQFKPDEQISYGEAIRAWKKAQQLKTAE